MIFLNSQALVYCRSRLQPKTPQNVVTKWQYTWYTSYGFVIACEIQNL